MDWAPAFAAALAFTLPNCAAADDITVFAASSLKSALDQLAADWQAQSGDVVHLSYAGSAALARQIEQGAPADVYIAASGTWMDQLETDGLIKPDTRRDLAGNTLVLIGAGADLDPIELTPDLDLAGLLLGGKLAMGLIPAVPAGEYGQQALVSLGQWDRVQAQVVQTDSVRAALALVVSGEAAMGIVYGSDYVAQMANGGGISLLATFPDSSHTPVRYPAALIGDNAQAAVFLNFLASPEARKEFLAQGFTGAD